GGAEHPVHARDGERLAHPVEHLAAGGHRLTAGADAEGAARGMVRGDDHHAAVGVRDGLAGAGRGQARDPARILDPHPRDLVVGADEGVAGPRRGGGVGGGGVGGAHRVASASTPRLRRAASICSTVWPWLGSPPAMRRSISSVVGMAVEHSRRLVTMAPAALQRVSISSRDCPVSRPWQSEPPKLSPGPSPLVSWIRFGATTTWSSAVLPSTPSGPCLTIAICTPASS